MAFNLKKVLKALLLSTNQPLSIKDIQATFARFHRQRQEPLIVEEDMAEAPAVVEKPTVGDAPTVEKSRDEKSKSQAVESQSAAEDGTAAVSGEVAGAEPAPQPPSDAAAPQDATVPDAAGVPQGTETAPAANGEVAAVAASPVAAATEPAEVPVHTIEPSQEDPEIYGDVPELVTVTMIRETMEKIADELRSAEDGLLLIEGANGYRVVTHPKFGRWIRIMRQEPPPVKLNQSSVETLAVIAYRQPVTRTEIEQIRGVSAEAGVNKLLERELIYIVGRADLPGRPLQYGTTDKFLEFVGIKSCDELPASDVLSSRQIDEWLTNSSTAHKPDDTDMGLSDEQLPLEGAATAPAEKTEPTA